MRTAPAAASGISFIRRDSGFHGVGRLEACGRNTPSELPAGPSQEHAYEDLFENWTRTDAVAAGQNLMGMDPGPARDTAIQAFSKTLVRDRPEGALVWAGAITDTNQRADVQVELARRWRKSSPDEAAAWVAGNLSGDLQARVLLQTP